METLVGADIERLATQALNRKKLLTLRKFKALFAFDPIVVASIWRKLCREEALPAQAVPKHLLWMLCFLKVYSSEHVHAELFNTNERTFCDWVWRMMKAVHYLEVVSMWCRSGWSENSVLPLYFLTKISSFCQDHTREQICRCNEW